MSLFIILPKTNNQSGAIAVSTAIMLTMLVGFVALSIDTGHLVVTKNELRNAADAGALAGAINLYSNDGKVIQTGIIYAPDNVTVIATKGCNEIAYNTAIKNYSDNNPVEVKWAGGNAGDVERGHWSFGKGTPTNPPSLTRGFYPNASTALTGLWDVSETDLDHDSSFINAVRITTRRETLPIVSFFAKIFGYDSFQQTATAVAYIGFAGTFGEGEFEIPMAICEEFLGPQPYTCGDTVMFEHAENAMWTNMEQPDLNADGSLSDTCNSADGNELKEVIADGNKKDLFLGGNIGVTNGIVDDALRALIVKWKENSTVDEDTKQRNIWVVVLPVIDCVDDDGTVNNTCAKLVGGVRVELLWMTKMANALAYAEAPKKYYDADGDLIFSCTEAAETDDYLRWKEFAEDPDIDIVDSEGVALPLELKKLYFRTSCDYAEPSGGPGGPNYGTLSERPALVD